MGPIRITTVDSLDYRYIPITKSSVNIGIKASHDARIALRTHLGCDSNMYEIIIGGWGNSMSVIKRTNFEQDVAETVTKDILNPDEICDIFIQWSCDGLLSVSCEADLNRPFLHYRDMSPFVINYLGVSTAWGATGEWIIEECQFTLAAIKQQLIDTSHFWVDFIRPCGRPPRTAVIASEDGLYVGRTRHRGSVTPGGIRDTICTFAWGGIAHEERDFQVLCGVKNVNWVKSWEGSVPLYALPAGETEDGYALFIGRVLYKDIYYIGKIQPNHQVCYAAVNGQEVPFEDYEVLVIYDNYGIEHIGR